MIVKSEKDFKRNRNIQKQIEKLFSVEPDVSLVCLGDMNGRLTKLEPGIKNDANGDMIENWILKYDLNHLNQTENCEGIYTFSTKNGKSAIDHILVNDQMFTKFKGMHIDEGKELLDISDHNLLRAWFKISPTHILKNKKEIYKNISWIKKDDISYEKFKNHFKKTNWEKVTSETI